MSFQLIDALYRSRLTVLSLLKRRGYNVTPFERFSTREVELMYSKTNPVNHALDFRVEKEDSEDTDSSLRCDGKPRYPSEILAMIPLCCCLQNFHRRIPVSWKF